MEILMNTPALLVVASPVAQPLLRSNHEICIDVRHGWKRFKMGSVASYELEYNGCPIHAVERAIKNGHDLHWANPECGVLTSGPKDQETRLGFELGEEFRFEGRNFVFQQGSNSDNVKMIEVTT